jgi:hypothetical protein
MTHGFSAVTSYRNCPALNLQKQKLTAANQPAWSFLASSPAATHDHRSVQCQDLSLLSSLFLPLVKGVVGLFYTDLCSPFFSRGSTAQFWALAASMKLSVSFQLLDLGQSAGLLGRALFCVCVGLYLGRGLRRAKESYRLCTYPKKNEKPRHRKSTV